MNCSEIKQNKVQIKILTIKIQTKNMDEKDFMFPKKNMLLVAAGLVIVIIGFLLMTGSKTVVDFNPNVYSFRRIVIAPMISLAGFIFIIFAILHKNKSITKE